jgi:hypothetical protein
MLQLACDNAMQVDVGARAIAAIPSLRIQSVGDLAPVGLAVATIVLHLARHRPLSMADRTLVLVLGSLVGAFAGAISGLEFTGTALGFSTFPLLLFAIIGLETQALALRPHRLPERVWPIDLDKKTPKRSALTRRRAPTRESR